ncbi:DapH/DapD/GlmU-related protein [Actibacterium ureilyticum]|uniref:DapH/DapD/GlmU-related protein n=1 Tax=Actibacterium ureilyticum TaxID=1590614 RepID=UPI000BAAC3A4|nr:DapH/DapD/GlmU-related protein [Actibacterium ureilyticum]
MTRLHHDRPLIHPDCTITDSRFGAYVEIGAGSRVAHSEFGDYSYCDRFADIANATIGKFANIASFARVGPTDHPMQRASLHHFLYRSGDYWDDAQDDPEFFAHRRSRRARIGHDSWIGHNAIIRPEITVGDGAVVAAGAVVTRDVAPYMIVAGVPAAPLRTRFDPDTAARLVALAWWDWPHAALRAALTDFRTLSVHAFLEKYGG